MIERALPNDDLLCFGRHTDRYHTHVMKKDNPIMPSFDFDPSEEDDISSTHSPSTHTANTQAEIEQRREELAAKETKAVGKLKVLVFGILFLSMVAVALTTYFITSRAEQETFENQYYDDANKILSNMGQNLDRIFLASDAFAVSAASHAAHTNQTWPFVTIPNFAVRAEKIRSLCGAVYVNTYHTVEQEQRGEWERYTAIAGPPMVDEAIAAIAEFPSMGWAVTTSYEPWHVIYDYDEFDKENPGEEGVTYGGPYLPLWQIQPTIAELESPYNWDLMSVVSAAAVKQRANELVLQERKPVLTEPYFLNDPNDPDAYEHILDEANWLSQYLPNKTLEEIMQPMSDLFYPIFEKAHEKIEWVDQNFTKEDHKVVAFFSVSIFWKDTLANILPKGNDGIHVVFENPCTPPFTFEINGPSAIYLGTGDFHDSQYNDMAQGSMIYDLRSFSELSSSFYSGLPLEESFCPLMVTVYPSKTKEDSYTTSTPWVFALLTGCVFIFTVLAFIVYNCVVERRQKIVYKSAMVSNALVSSLFPEEVKKQLMKTHELEELGMSTGHDMSAHKLQGFLDEEYNGGIADKIDIKNANQIAELFPDTTVMFADITGFTAWSSTREPSHVFTLLETLYGAFDQSARKMGIFKVETIGDCYVAVCGLPTPTSHHATKMARFASICIDLMKSVTGKLELSLGPGTADLLLRVGLHSGPTIAGVLRGEKARFQLFGDTVNTASRMESNSLPSKIHVSQSTADLITKAGKDHWLTPREDRVETKGKGLLQTYWIDPKKHKSLGSVRSSTGGTEGDDSNSGSVNDDSANIFVADDPKTVRLVNWNVSIFEDLLKVIAESRQANSGDAVATVVKEDVVPEGKSVRDSAVPSLKMPGFNTANCRLQGSAELSSEVKYELNLFITAVADLYTSSNAFHNFDHASHVIMSTVKLLQRVATSEIVKANELDAKQHHESTYGIGTDPLTKFAIVFSALVHDLDHAGVPNGQLVKENDPIALSYENGSQMEQHSFTLAFELLLNEEYQNLRAAIYETQEEYDRFRQLCINCVIATDVFDKELKTFRESRWEKAFNDTSTAVISKEEEFNMRGTIAVEYIIQASDVAHTMQHWHVYQRWNKRLFLEMRDAYKAGRAEKDPAEGWYKGELWFFDNYIIPLAQKLKECEVFGVDCDQLLDYAAQNRKEWCSKGEDIVAQWVAEAEQAHTVSD